MQFCSSRSTSSMILSMKSLLGSDYKILSEKSRSSLFCKKRRSSSSLLCREMNEFGTNKFESRILEQCETEAIASEKTHKHIFEFVMWQVALEEYKEKSNKQISNEIMRHFPKKSNRRSARRSRAVPYRKKRNISGKVTKILRIDDREDKIHKFSDEYRRKSSEATKRRYKK
jgi:hypothetical protein